MDTDKYIFILPILGYIYSNEQKGRRLHASFVSKGSPPLRLAEVRMEREGFRWG